MTELRPFWRYYGGKWRAAPKYSAPRYGHIVEPFAGAAGYSLRHHRHAVTLVDAYPVIAGIWRYLIAVKPAEVLAIPLVDAVADLPSWVPQEARWLVGMRLNQATTAPRATLSAGLRTLRETGRDVGWTAAARDLVASQVDAVKHWRIIEGDYTAAPDVVATWFVDPPYRNRAGSYYKHQPANFEALGAWCCGRRGQVMVCENAGADWLPFAPFAETKAGPGRQPSREALWQNDPAPSLFGAR